MNSSAVSASFSNVTMMNRCSYYRDPQPFVRVTCDDLTTNILSSSGATLDTVIRKTGTGSIRLNGQNSFVMLNPITTTNNGISIMTWYNTSATENNIFERLFDFGNGNAMDNFSIFCNNGYTCNIYYGVNQAVTQNLFVNTFPTNNQWKHVCLTASFINSSTTTGSYNSFYVNGSLIGGGYGYYPRSILRQNCVIGNWYPINTQCMKGNIDDFCYYDKCLNASQVLSIYSKY